jgi:hypothetical protein
MPASRAGTDDLDNIAFACQACNGYKHTSTTARDPVTGDIVPLFNPRTDCWQDHFAWSQDFSTVSGVTPIGRATVEKLDVNREGVVNLRRVLHAAGEHP